MKENLIEEQKCKECFKLFKEDNRPVRPFAYLQAQCACFNSLKFQFEGGLLLTGTVKLEWQKLNEKHQQTIRNIVAYCEYLDPEAPWDDFNDLELKTIILDLYEGFIGSVTVVDEDILGFWFVLGWDEWLLEDPRNNSVYSFAFALSG